MAEKTPSGKRGGIAFLFIVLLGYALGYLIKNVRVGLIIGLAMGLLASGILRRR
jgi:uncharacterized membrane protein (UPF0136 family)